MPTAAEALAQAKWRSSGLTDEAAIRLGMKGLDAAQTLRLHHRFYPISSLFIPYFSFTGQQTQFYRIRYLEDLPGFAGQVEKPQKYAQAPGSLNEVYLPPVLPENNWAGIAQDPTINIYITEGELKAAAGSMHGFPTIGLGGVDVWRSAKRGITLLPQLTEIRWNPREVYIVFDSDAARNPNVISAQRRLALELLALGAKPIIVAIPGSSTEKVGLDDYLLAKGPEEFIKLIGKAPAFPEGAALWELNEKIAYARDPGIVIERDTGRKISVQNFVNHAYANKHFIEQVVTPGGRVGQKRSALAPRWVGWEHRFEVDRIVYEPGQPSLVDGAWNSWRGWGAEEKEGSVELWSELLDYFFSDDPAARKWFEQWCAYPIQHPGAKLYTSCLLWSSRHGTGKTLLAYLLKSVYGDNGIEIDSDALRSSFNAWAENRQLVVGDEITAGDSRLDKDKLKGLITRAIIRINQKYMPEFTIRDCVNYLFTSNAPDALFVEDWDRRYFIQEIVGEPKSRSFYDRCDTWLHGEAAANLLWHLRRVDLTGFNPREHAYITTSKRSMIYNGKSDMGVFVAELREDPSSKLRPLGNNVAEQCDLFTPSAILSCYDPDGRRRATPNGLSREMIRAGFRQLNGGVPIRTKVGLVRLYAVRNHDAWVVKSPRALAEHYERFFLNGQKISS